MTCQICSSVSRSSQAGIDRVPGRRFLGQARPALGDAPEEVGLLEHRDRARVLEVRGRRVEAVARSGPCRPGCRRGSTCSCGCRCRRPAATCFLKPAWSLRSGLSSPEMLISLPRNWIDAGGAGMHGAQLGRRLRLGRGLRVGVVAEQQRQRRSGARAAARRLSGSTRVERIGRRNSRHESRVGGDEDEHGQQRRSTCRASARSTAPAAGCRSGR